MEILLDNVKFVVSNLPHLFRDLSSADDARNLLILSFTRTVDRASINGLAIDLPLLKKTSYEASRLIVSAQNYITETLDPFSPSREFLESVANTINANNLTSDTWYNGNADTVKAIYELYAEELARCVDRLMKTI